jgi:hypothetical protein
MTGLKRVEIEALEKVVERKFERRQKFYNPKGKAAKKKSAEVAAKMRERVIERIEESITSQISHGDLRARVLLEKDYDRAVENATQVFLNWIREGVLGRWSLNSEREVEFEFTRSRGAGGQHVNKVQTAVKAIHIPSGITAEDQSSRDRNENEVRAIGHLKQKLERHLGLWKEFCENEHGLKNKSGLGQKVSELVLRVVYTKSL